MHRVQDIKFDFFLFLLRMLEIEWDILVDFHLFEDKMFIYRISPHETENNLDNLCYDKI